MRIIIEEPGNLESKVWLEVIGQYERLHPVFEMTFNEDRTWAQVKFTHVGEHSVIEGPCLFIEKGEDFEPAGMIRNPATGQWMNAVDTYNNLMRFLDQAASYLHFAMTGQPELEAPEWQDKPAYIRAGKCIERLFGERNALRAELLKTLSEEEIEQLLRSPVESEETQALEGESVESGLPVVRSEG